jgi:hypothetical protein
VNEPVVVMRTIEPQQPVPNGLVIQSAPSDPVAIPDNVLE